MFGIYIFAGQKGLYIIRCTTLLEQDLVTSTISGEWYNFCFPVTNNIHNFILGDLEKEFKRLRLKPSIFLLEDHVQLGFCEYLIRNGYKFDARDTWMGYDKASYLNTKVDTKINLVTPRLFSDYKTVLGEVFSDFPGNDSYLEICRQTISGEMLGENSNLKSELYLIYEKDRPVAGAGMFYSTQDNFAYLHDAGTLEKFRGKGYQSNLLRFRINRALENRIDRIYSSVDHGGKSWENLIKVGMNQMHTSLMFTKK